MIKLLKVIWVRDNVEETGICSGRRFLLESDSNVPGMAATIGTVQCRPHAQQIVRAVNSHAEMLEALKGANTVINALLRVQVDTKKIQELWDLINTAIKRAEGKE